MRTIPFTKMHGLGNDYIYVNVIENPLDDPSTLSVLWSDRHKGIGSDGLILIGPSDKADFSMRIFNADGSEALMCGNGSRCVGRYIHDKGLSDKTVIKLETLSGIKVLNLHLDRKGQVRDVTVDMGKGLPLEVVLPDGSRGQWILEAVFACGKRFRGTAVDVGNPHLVLFVPDAESAPVAEAGPLFEKDVMFPHRANIEFAQVLDERHIRMRVWQRNHAGLRHGGLRDRRRRRHGRLHPAGRLYGHHGRRFAGRVLGPQHQGNPYDWDGDNRLRRYH